MKLLKEGDRRYVLTSSSKVYNYLKEFEDEDREYFIVIGLDTANKPVYREIVSVGTLNSSLIHPREVFKQAIMMSVNSIIIAHNHPSGDCSPSKEDKEVTKLLTKGGELLQIKVLDHIIIGKNQHYSFLTEGLL